MSGWTARAPGKVNLVLRLGPTRADGRHALVTLIQSLSLSDRVRLEPAPGSRGDRVDCPGVSGPNLAGDALARFRAASGWDAPPLLVRIDKRVPVAAGMGGGSGDAAATLRLAGAAAGLPSATFDDLVAHVAPALGSDVPSQLRPGVALGTGAGDRVENIAGLAPHAVLVVPAGRGLSTAAVYREADRLGLARTQAELVRIEAEVRASLAGPGPTALPMHLLGNDLQPAACSLLPGIDDTLDAVIQAGAARALVTGSGPTVVGLFPGEDGARRAAVAAAALLPRWPQTTVAEPVGEAFGAPVAWG